MAQGKIRELIAPTSAVCHNTSELEVVMLCPYCGYLMSALDKDCPRCHGKGNPSPVIPPQLPAQLNQPSANSSQPQFSGGNGIASMVLGIIGIFAWFIPVAGLPVTITGVILGIKSREPVNRGMSTAGIVLSIIGLVLTVANMSIGAYMGATGQHPIANSFVSPGQPSASGQGSAAAINGSAYQVTPATGWQQIGNNAASGVELMLASPAVDGFAPNLNVVVVPATPGETLENDKAQMAVMFPKMFTNYAQVGQGDITVGGLPAFYNTSTSDSGTPPQRLWTHQVFVLKNNQAYTFTCSTLDSNHSDQEGVFQSMIQSVRWTK